MSKNSETQNIPGFITVYSVQCTVYIHTHTRTVDLLDLGLNRGKQFSYVLQVHGVPSGTSKQITMPSGTSKQITLPSGRSNQITMPSGTSSQITIVGHRYF